MNENSILWKVHDELVRVAAALRDDFSEQIAHELAQDILTQAAALQSLMESRLKNK